MYGDLPIKRRIPYQMYGELDLGASATPTQFPEATFQNQNNKTFEIHRLIPRVYAMKGGVIFNPQPTMSVLMALVRVQFRDVALEQALGKTAVTLDALVKGSTELTWELADPHYLPNNSQLQTTVETLAFPAEEPFAEDIDALRVVLNWQGFLVVTGPAVA